MARKLAVLLLPPVVLAALGAVAAVRLGYTATQGAGYTLVGVGAAVALAMGSAGSDAISGWEMRMDGREPQGRRGRRWAEQAWATGAEDPRSLPQYDSSIDRWLVAGIAYAGLGIAILLLF